MAEEGSVYFANAYKFGFMYSIIFVDFKSGYLNLWANISGIISNIFDLKIAPLISNYLALIPKLLIIYVALFCNSFLLKKLEHKFLFCLLVFLSPLNVPEIWMNSINSQIFFSILAFTIIFINFNDRSINNFYLILAGLTGIYSCILTPLYFFKYYIYRIKQDFLHFIILSCCSIVQFSLILYGKFSNLIFSGKIHPIDFDIIINYIYNVFVKAFFGTSLTKYIYFNYLKIDLNIIVYTIISIFLIFSFFIFFLLKEKININSENRFAIFSSLYALIATSLIVMSGATGEYVGGRYAALPSFYLLSFILIIYKLFDYFSLRLFFLSLLLISIFSGMYEFRPPTKNVKYQYIRYLDCINCPNWKNEIENFKRDNNYLLKIWPYPQKVMNLS